MRVRFIVKVITAERESNSPRGRLAFSATIERINMELATIREVGME